MQMTEEQDMKSTVRTMALALLALSLAGGPAVAWQEEPQGQFGERI